MRCELPSGYMNSVHTHFANAFLPATIWSCQCSTLLCADLQLVRSGEQRNCQHSYQRRWLQVKWTNNLSERFHANTLINRFFKAWMDFLCNFPPLYAVFFLFFFYCLSHSAPMIAEAACQAAGRLRKCFNRDITMAELTSEKATHIFTAAYVDIKIQNIHYSS